MGTTAMSSKTVLFRAFATRCSSVQDVAGGGGGGGEGGERDDGVLKVNVNVSVRSEVNPLGGITKSNR